MNVQLQKLATVTDLPIGTYDDSSSDDESCRREEMLRYYSREKAVTQQKQELGTTEKDYKETVRKLKDDSSAALTRNVLPTERWVCICGEYVMKPETLNTYAPIILSICMLFEMSNDLITLIV
ncbi:hypothetical protein DPMN_071445 [Dreissena polymorpha]|uniref:Uncharacterized protein n=1 Tax=Dreissena polymorpha TaxID=45954 RepID=A0A9D3Z6Q1_DREPO|nr:hypothetical protein DPMN_071445 [Dreissena polymorpha]